MIYRSLLSFFSGVVFTLGFPNFFYQSPYWQHQLFWLAPLGILIFLINWTKINTCTNQACQWRSTNLWHLWLFQLGHSLTGYNWISYTLQTFGGLDQLPSYLGILAFSTFVRPQLWILLCLSLTHKKIEQSPIFHPLSLALIFTLADHITPQLFPLPLGHSIIEFGPNLNLVTYTGAWIYTFLLYSTVFYTFFAIKKISFAKLPAVVVASLLFIELSPISFIKHHKSHDEKTVYIRIVQANIGNFLKIESELGGINSLKEVYHRYQSLSLASGQYNHIDLIIWPETAYPHNFDSEQLQNDLQHYSQIHSPIRKVLEQSNSPLLMGGYDQGYLDRSQNNIFSEYNSVFLFRPQQGLDSVYHKHVLLMFGETLPFGKYNEHLRDFFAGVSLFSQGANLQSFQISPDFFAITPICYEILIPSFIRNYLNTAKNHNSGKNPNAIINLTNDSWYGITAQPHQHLFLSRWRSLEFAIPTIRATNTGISAIIDHHGKVLAQTGIDQQLAFDFSLKLNTKQPVTLYQRWGDYPLFSLSLLLFFIHCLYYLKKRKRKIRN